MRSYDDQVTNPEATDAQVLAVRAARSGYLGDRLIRVASHDNRCSIRGAGPLIAVKLHVLTRKSLGGCETDLSARVLSQTVHRSPGSTPWARRPGLVAAECTATARSKGPSWVAACSPDEWRGPRSCGRRRMAGSTIQDALN